jgi:hypothetical protein
MCMSCYTRPFVPTHWPVATEFAFLKTRGISANSGFYPSLVNHITLAPERE